MSNCYLKIRLNFIRLLERRHEMGGDFTHRTGKREGHQGQLCLLVPFPGSWYMGKIVSGYVIPGNCSEMTAPPPLPLPA